MGLLDDAIREHLELKRRRGADPAEIERDEQEALGPVRRAPEEDENGPLEAASHADEDDYEAEEDDGWEDDPLAEDSDAFAEEPELFEDERQSRADESSPFDEDDDDPFGDEPEGRRGASPSSDPNPTQIFNQEGDEPSPPPPPAASPPPPRGERSEET
ncbi:MAG: hypothetical protein ACTHQQ_13750, partial [Solirubrobacteraceae bacterium]